MKIKTIISISFLVFFVVSVIGSVYFYFFSGFNLRMDYALGDQWIYQRAIFHYYRNENFYTEYFGYFPSFFLISFLVEDLMIYFAFLSTCAVVSFYLLFQLTSNKIIAISVGIINFLTIFSGNIDPFVCMVVLLSLYYKENEVIPSILLAFICFKPTTFLIVPYFFFVSKHKVKFIMIFITSFMAFNFYFLLHAEYVFYYYDYCMGFYSNRLDYLRPVWVWYVLYHVLIKEDKKISSVYFFPIKKSFPEVVWRSLS